MESNSVSTLFLSAANISLPSTKPYFGRRVKKLASGLTTIYNYDVAGNLISESEADGTPLRDIVYLNGERVAMRLYGSQAGRYYFVNDHLGTPQKIVDVSGSVVWQAAYLPFGKAQVLAGSSITNNFRFPGQYYDAETELHQNWHRYQMPGKGRYLTPDPVGLAAGINLYAYVTGNPVNLTDSSGLAGGEAAISWGEAAIGVAEGEATIGAGGIIIIIGGIILVTPTQLGDGMIPPGLLNEDSQENTCPVSDVTRGRDTKGRTRQYEKEGDMDTANDDFDSLDPSNVRNIPNGGRIGVLPDGRKIIVRPNSSDGRPTIEVQRGKNKVKIRYGE